MAQENSRIGAIGEHMVMVQLFLQGWDAYNANASVTNREKIDIICIRDIESTSLVQVKTSYQSSFPIGMTLEQAQDRKYLEEHIIGPWVFVRATGKGCNTRFRYYVLSREQVTDLIYKSNDWYLNQVQRSKPVNKKSLCAIMEAWLTGNDYKAPRLNAPVFENPLKGCTAEGAWNNIWSK